GGAHAEAVPVRTYLYAGRGRLDEEDFDLAVGELRRGEEDGRVPSKRREDLLAGEPISVALGPRGGVGRGDRASGALLRVAGRVDPACAVVAGDTGDLLAERSAARLRDRGRDGREHAREAHRHAREQRERGRCFRERLDCGDGLRQALPFAAEL